MSKKIIDWETFERLYKHCYMCGGIDEMDCEGTQCEYWQRLEDVPEPKHNLIYKVRKADPTVFVWDAGGIRLEDQ